MKLNRVLDLIKTNEAFFDKCREGKKYYSNKNDILEKGVCSTSKESVGDDVLRHADNRVTHSFHPLLTDEKASYMFTYEPIIDVDDNENNVNSVVNEILGDNFSRKLKNLCIESTNCGVAWLHYWIDDKNQEFKFEKVNTEEVIPITDSSLEKNILEIIRYYDVSEYIDEETTAKKVYRYIEVWNDKEFTKYKLDAGATVPVNTETYTHQLGRVPFIKFANNMNETGDLDKYKKQIDLYDKVMSGYANDMEDIQQIIYILENYGGQDLDEFKTNLKRYKTIEVESNQIQGKGDFRTIQIDIPVEARKVILEELKKQIYEFAQGLQQDVESFGNASGVALKFFYRKLELKCGVTETEFRGGISELVGAILRYKGIPYKKIQQTYTRNMISNDVENAQIAQQSVGVVPTKVILQNHPWIDDVDEALKLLDEEKIQLENSLEDEYQISNEQPIDNINTQDNNLNDITAKDIKTEAKEEANKTLNGAQTQSLISIISQFTSGIISEGQAINLISISIGIDKEKAKNLLNGVV